MRDAGDTRSEHAAIDTLPQPLAKLAATARNADTEAFSSAFVEYLEALLFLELAVSLARWRASDDERPLPPEVATHLAKLDRIAVGSLLSALHALPKELVGIRWKQQFGVPDLRSILGRRVNANALFELAVQKRNRASHPSRGRFSSEEIANLKKTVIPLAESSSSMREGYWLLARTVRRDHHGQLMVSRSARLLGTARAEDAQPFGKELRCPLGCDVRERDVLWVSHGANGSSDRTILVLRPFVIEHEGYVCVMTSRSSYWSPATGCTLAATDVSKTVADELAAAFDRGFTSSPPPSRHSTSGRGPARSYWPAVLVGSLVALGVLIAVGLAGRTSSPSTDANRDTRPAGTLTVVSSHSAPASSPGDAPNEAASMPESVGEGSPPTIRAPEAPPLQRPPNFLASPSGDVRLQDTEATLEQYRACVAAGACTPPDLSTATDLRELCTWSDGRPTAPINCLTVQESVDLCTWLGLAFAGRPGRLPTVREWESATGWALTRRAFFEDRGGTGENFCDTSFRERYPADRFCVETSATARRRDGHAGPAPVGRPESQNARGFFDVLGNLTESAVEDERTFRVGRGFRIALTPSNARSVVGSPLREDDRVAQHGVRCAIDVPRAEPVAQ